jgi:hypothetical protein
MSMDLTHRIRAALPKLRLVLIALVALLALQSTATLQADGNGQWFVAILTGHQEVPPRATPAAGLAVFYLNEDGRTLQYLLGVRRIQNVVAAHIHTGAPGTNGPVLVGLYGQVPPGGGPIEGVIAAGKLPATAALLNAMQSGQTYVNVHTNDGTDPVDTGPGDFPGGEIRGQVYAVSPAQVPAEARETIINDGN